MNNKSRIKNREIEEKYGLKVKYMLTKLNLAFEGRAQLVGCGLLTDKYVRTAAVCRVMDPNPDLVGSRIFCLSRIQIRNTVHVIYRIRI
jgi:hypothetical protein